MIFLFLAFFFILYFIPAIVARERQHVNITAITVLNVFLGWTLIGWVVALVWACMAQPERIVNTIHVPTSHHHA